MFFMPIAEYVRLISIIKYCKILKYITSNADNITVSVMNLALFVMK